ncbi:MAG: tRNA (adenosine(37)-N6)-threonylcarbamoyltransferase complex dimerization subunit type 1 TsaB [Peptococcaceae bacterium]|nr:tRNA (adenosine(37)-N6)-threonylcarbamoyltransferase complex dimerization subunit type 1 TsaB [Peptococcaceae bacterium]
MKYLTIDTTTKVTALSLAQDGHLVGEGFLHTGTTHSEKLIPMLDQLLNAASWKLEELDFIGVVRGPGSFTGIRIGIATAQGLAQVLKKPLIGLTSLDALAWAGWGRPEETVVILDARKGEWYYARYRYLQTMVCVDGPMAITPEELMAKLKQKKEQFFLVGDAVKGAKQYLEEKLGTQAVIPLEHHYLPRGAYAACEAWAQWLKVKDDPDLADKAVLPFYIRLSEAEVNYRKKHNQQETGSC